MKCSRNTFIVTIVVILLVVLIFNAIYTWGITFYCTGGFQREYIKTFENILPGKQTGTIRLGEYVNDPIACIPLVFYVYRIDPPPYAIYLRIADDTELISKIFIESITIQYVGHKTIENKVNWEREFVKSSVLRSIGSGRNATFPVMKLNEKLPVTVDRRKSCDIRLVGYFVKDNEEKIPFDTTAHFEYKPHKWKIAPARGSF